jgi:hypothetical protein
MSAWPQAVASIGMPGLHFHDLRHTGNQFAANSRAGLRDLMARMGQDSERAAMIYQHEARGADQAITDAIDTHVEAEQRKNPDEGSVTGLPANGTLIARRRANRQEHRRPGVRKSLPAWAFILGAGDGNRTRTVSLGTG